MNNIYYTICAYNLIGIHALMWLLRLNVHIYVCLAWEVNWPRFSNDWCVQCFMQPIHVHQFQWNVKYKWSRISSLLSLILNMLDKFLVCKNINWIKIAAHCQLWKRHCFSEVTYVWLSTETRSVYRFQWHFTYWYI